jgi:hypothetical protein
MLHQDETRRDAPAGAEPARQHRADVAAVGKAADIIVVRVEAVAAELEHVAARPRADEIGRGAGVRKFLARRHLKPKLREELLGKKPVILQPIAERAAADDREAVAAKLVLERAETLGHGLEDDDALFARLADPVELGAPVAGPLDHVGERALRLLPAHRHLQLMAVRGQRKVKRAEVARFRHREKSHPVTSGGHNVPLHPEGPGPWCNAGSVGALAKKRVPAIQGREWT